MEPITLSTALNKEVLDVKRLPLSYPGQLNDVFLVSIENEKRVFKSPRNHDYLSEPFFVYGELLFGLDLSNHELAKAIANEGADFDLRLPHIFDPVTIDGRRWSVSEYLVGSPLKNFATAEVGYILGRGLGTIHATRSFAPIPSPSTSAKFQDSLLRILDDASLTNFASEELIRQTRSVVSSVVLEPFVPILLDQDPTQYLLMESGELALIDVECLVYGPVELDLVSLELLLDERSAREFKRGYSEIRPFPDLEPARTAMRFVHRLLEVQGSSKSLMHWVSQPNLFS